MSRTEQLRTFVAVYRARSVTDGAEWRGLSQPAVSQQLAGLERAVGAPLFVRTPRGVEPTDRGVALYADAASVVDQLEVVLGGLEVPASLPHRVPLRIGTTAEFFSAEVVRAVARSDLAVVARFEDDAQLVEGLHRGELDVVVTGAAPTRRSLGAVPVGERRFVLVAAPGVAPDAPLASLTELGDWLVGRAWVAYSVDLPITRRFFQAHLRRPFSARLRLVAPDLRAVRAAVEQGIGCSILPAFVCTQSLDEGRIVEVHPVSDLIPAEPWFACFRSAEIARPQIVELIGLLGPRPSP